jgi:hypothetical protein
MLEAAQRDLVGKAEAAAMWQARAEMLAGQLEQTRQELRALAAPREQPAPTPDPAAAPRHAPEDDDAPRRRWWWPFGA